MRLNTLKLKIVLILFLKRKTAIIAQTRATTPITQTMTMAGSILLSVLASALTMEGVTWSSEESVDESGARSVMESALSVSSVFF